MARYLRSLLMKIPHVQRQLKRIADLEVMVQQQQARGDAMDAAARQSSEDHAAQRQQIAELEALARHQQDRLGAMDAMIRQALGGSPSGPAPAPAPALPDAERQSLLGEIAKRDQESRLLRVGHGSTFEELEAAGKIGGGTPYTFEELLSLQQAQAAGAPTVPPLVFLHVPKAGGTTLNNILMKNYRYRLDSYGDTFFPRYYPDEFVSLVQPPKTDDTRRPVYFTGHINVDNDVFRYMPVRYVAITMLRDPVRRLVSHYRFHATLPGSHLAAAIKNDSLGIADYFQRFRALIPLQYEVFAPRKDADEADLVQEALRNLDAKVSLFGLQENYDAFVVLMKELLGLPDVFYAPMNKTPSHAPAVEPQQIDQIRALLKHDIAFYEGAKNIYEKRISALDAEFGERVKAFGEAKRQYFAFIGGGQGAGHAWRGYYAGLTDG